MKKTILILIGILVLGGGLYFFINTRQNQGTNSGEKDNTSFRSFFPFSADKSTKENTEDTVDTGEKIEDAQEEEVVESENNNLSKITDFAISGYTVFQAERNIENPKTTPEESKEDTKKTTDENKNVSTETETVSEKQIVDTINFVEKSTGHIYEYPLDTQKPEKISNSTIPGVYEVFFGNNNQSVLYRYVNNTDKIQSYIATFGAEKGQFLPENIDQVALSPDKNEVFYLNTVGDNVFGLIFSFKTNTKKQIFSHDFTEWLPQWINKQAIFMTTKPSWNVEGSLYGLNISNGAITKILGNTKGLTTLANHAGSAILYNKTTNNGPLLNIFKGGTHTSLSLYGLPEKCVWSKDNINIYCAIPSSITTAKLPDQWYQGLVSFEDMFIKINIENGDKSMLSSGEYSIDATNLSLSPNEDKLFFVDKKDGALWSFDLK